MTTVTITAITIAPAMARLFKAIGKLLRPSTGGRTRHGAIYSLRE
jgi:hypothetical protein